MTAVTLACAGLVALGPALLPAQPRADSLLAAARRLVSSGDTTEALAVLDRAQQLAPRNPEVLYQRGVLLARTTELSVGDVPRNWVAWRLLDRAAEIDPTNARYLLEMGRVRLLTPILRVEAERIMRKAMQVAVAQNDRAMIAETAFELGQIKERRYLGSKDRYMVTSTGLSFDPDLAMLRRHYTREFLESHAKPITNAGLTDRSEAEEWYRRALAALPTHAPSATGLLGLLYDQQRFEEMRGVAEPFVTADSAPALHAPVLFGGGVAAYRLRRPREAERLFARALAALPEPERTDMTSLSRLLRRRDADAYERLSAIDRRLTDSAYWEAADPLLGTSENEARIEFLARVAVATLRFTSPDLKQVGWRTDRGLILARYGEPPVTASFAPTNRSQRTAFGNETGSLLPDNAGPLVSDSPEAAGRVITVWYYPRNDRQFVFTGPLAMNYATFAGPMRGFAEEQREDAPFLLDNVAELRGIDSIPLQIARFRGAADTSTQMVVAYALRPDRLYGNSDLADGALITSLRVGPPTGMQLRRTDTVAVTLPSARTTERLWVESIRAPRTRVRVEAQDATVTNARARAHVEIDALKPPRPNALTMSDLLFAQRASDSVSVTLGWQRAGLVPMGDLLVAQRQAFSVYWENYGLRPNADGRVRADVRFRITLLEIDRSNQQTIGRWLGEVGDLVGLTKEAEEQLSVRFDREDAVPAGDRLPMMNTIGLGTAPAGVYRLEVMVTDLVSGRMAQSERVFRLGRQ